MKRNNTEMKNVTVVGNKLYIEKILADLMKEIIFEIKFSFDWNYKLDMGSFIESSRKVEEAFEPLKMLVDLAATVGVTQEECMTAVKKCAIIILEQDDMFHRRLAKAIIFALSNSEISGELDESVYTPFEEVVKNGINVEEAMAELAAL